MEQELKYAFSEPALAIALLTSRHLLSTLSITMLSPWHEDLLHTIYYDTPCLALHGADIALRLRRHNQGYTLTCKHSRSGSGNLHQQQEEEIDLSVSPATPQELPWQQLPSSAMLQELLQGKELSELGSTAFQRKFRRVKYQKSIIEIALDQGKFRKGQQSLAFLELELELQAGKLDDLLTIGEALAQAYKLLPERRSKLERTLALPDSN